MKSRRSKSSEHTPKFPKGWLEFSSIGSTVDGTPFIPFKTPMSKELLLQFEIPESHHFTIDSLFAEMEHRNLKLGLVIELCNTPHYDLNELISRGIQHVKLPCQVNSLEKSLPEFIRVVDDFLEENSNEIIGVHCLHGLNRTGFMICAYAVKKLGIYPDEAIRRFEVARGHHVKTTKGLIRSLKDE